MKIKFGAIVTDGRGKLGGHVASKNRGGSYLRTKVTPSNPQTEAQSAVRALFGSLSQGWSALSAAVRAGWDSAVSDWTSTNIFGDLKTPTGKSLYVKLNQQAILAGHSPITDAPAKEEMPNSIITACTLDTSTNALDFEGLNDSADVKVVIFATPKLSQGTTFVKNKLRQLNTFSGNGPQLVATVTKYEAKYGTIEAGDNIYFGVKYVLANGQASPMQTLKADIS